MLSVEKRRRLIGLMARFQMRLSEEFLSLVEALFSKILWLLLLAKCCLRLSLVED
jgi:hypothetical protein